MEGGYGWVIVFATFVINGIVQGVIASSGILLNVLLDQFHASKAVTGWILSLLGGLLLAVGPLSSFLTEKYGCRRVTIIGACVSAFGCFISSFATGVTFLIFSYGIVTGFGFGLIYLPQTIVLAEWFKEKRSTATGIGLSGAGFGAFIIPPVSQFILRNYGWSNYFLFCSGLVSLCCAFGMLLRPNLEIRALEKRVYPSSPPPGAPSSLIAWQFIKDPAFIVFCISTGLFSGSYRIPFSFLPDYSVRQLSSSRSDAAYLLSYLGVASFLGRLFSGVVGDNQRHRRYLVYLLLIVMSGACVVAMGLVSSYSQLALCALGYGAASGGRVALNSIILADIFGLPALSQTYGFVCLVQGISIFFGTPVAGWLSDVFGDYRKSFVLFGAGMTSCASVLTFIPVNRRATISGYAERQVSWILRILPFLIIPFFLGSTTTVGQTVGTTKPNIIFLLADDLGWNDVSFHGYNEIPTPNIDRLANEGVILNSYYAQYMCTPSRTALMTGKYPIRTGMQHYVLIDSEPRGLSTEEKILPQYLKELGYKTHMVGKWHLGYYRKAMTPTLRGFDSFFGYYTGMTDYYNYTPTAGVPIEYRGFDLWNNLEAAREFTGQYATELFTNKAVEKIMAHNYDNPLFMYISHLAPHYANENDPVQAPQKYFDRFPDIHHEGRRKYAATVSALDDSVGKIFESLKTRGVAENTIIIFASDNGGAGPEQGLLFGPPSTFANNWPFKGAKASHWEGGIRVSACVWSGLLEAKTRVSNELYHVTDWLPTLYKLAGGTSELQSLDGMDIWSSLSKGLPSPRRELLLQTDSVWHEYALRYEPEGGLDQKYITDVPGRIECEDSATADKVPCDANTKPCLFDIEADPCEYRNIAQDHPDIVDMLMQKIVAYNATALPSAILPRDPRAKVDLVNPLVKPWLD